MSKTMERIAAICSLIIFPISYPVLLFQLRSEVKYSFKMFLADELEIIRTGELSK